ncbi:DUF3624 domain-containing protein [Veronia pacifica]|uniref:DUF3624 domain-containing protein n=2 Tax=Veronia pacifica TaxID=1080227 RepID=A0A1C3EGP1_9GAMM|nr:DUF3624 domain-containing protein [Veronia pacifica]ODA32422.1 hypothetical protein A8L45_12935 [Veronia pacifica]
MSCQYCDRRFGSFSDKIGRCTQCMVQLVVMNAFIWPLWWWLYRDIPTSVESIALLFAGTASAGLLMLHLLLYPFRKKYNSDKTEDKESGL